VTGPLLTEAQMLRVLSAGTYTLDELYAQCEASVDIQRGGGEQPSTPRHPGDTRWRRRVRGALMHQKRTGRAKRLGRSCWLLCGSVEQPRAMLLLSPGADHEDLELHVADAETLLASFEEPLDLVLCDPPWGLDWDQRSARSHLGRDASKVLDGYRDVPDVLYMNFSRRWIAAAAGALRPGGQLVVITGPQRAAHVRIAAEQQLEWVCTIAAAKQFPLYTVHRPAPAHWSITVMCRGPISQPSRVFNPPRDLRRSQAGNVVSTDVWLENGRADRPGRLRYATELPLRLTRRLVSCFSNRGEHVCDPTLGGGSVALACWELRRRFTGADLNPKAVQYTAARLLTEHAWPAELQTPLFETAA
jgi:DNA modification methylase